jgi:hypothetical protein
MRRGEQRRRRHRHAEYEPPAAALRRGGQDADRNGDSGGDDPHGPREHDADGAGGERDQVAILSELPPSHQGEQHRNGERL